MESRSDFKNHLGGEKRPFEFSETILAEYPWLKNSTLSEKEKSAVSALISNNRTTTRCIPEISTGKPTIDVEYHLKLVESSLQQVLLFADKAPQLHELMQKESRFFQENKVATKKALGGFIGIGSKKRDLKDMGRYK